MGDSTISLEDKVKNWMVTSGFTLEMRVAREFAKTHPLVQMSSFYRDLETGTPREIDVVGRKIRHEESADRSILAELLINSFVECKGGTKHPWVVLKGLQSQYWLPDILMCTKRARAVLPTSNQEFLSCNLMANALGAGSGVTKALRQKSDGNIDSSYDALLQVFKAAEAHLTPRYKDDRTAVNRSPYLYLQPVIAIPVVVIRAPLFDCTLGHDGDVNVQKVNQSAVVFGYPQDSVFKKTLSDTKGVAIHIVHESALADFVASIEQFAEQMDKCLKFLLFDNFDAINKLTT